MITQSFFDINYDAIPHSPLVNREVDSQCQYEYNLDFCNGPETYAFGRAIQAPNVDYQDHHDFNDQNEMQEELIGQAKFGTNQLTLMNQRIEDITSSYKVKDNDMGESENKSTGATTNENEGFSTGALPEMEEGVMEFIEEESRKDNSYREFNSIPAFSTTKESDCFTTMESDISSPCRNVRRAQAAKQRKPRKEADSDSQKSSIQNKNRNLPGVITQRVIHGICLVLRGKSQGKKMLDYLENFFQEIDLSLEDVEALKRFIKGFNVNQKTWTGVKKNLSTNKVYGGILLACIQRFLSDEGEGDFVDWITNGKLTSSRDVLRANKKYFIEGFQCRFQDLFH